MVCFEPARLGKDVEAGTARLSKDTGRLGRHCLEPVCPCLPIHLWRTVKGDAAAQRRARDVILIAAVPRGQELWQHRMGQQLQCNRCMWQCRPQRHAMMCFAHRGHELLLLAHCVRLADRASPATTRTDASLLRVRGACTTPLTLP